MKFFMLDEYYKQVCDVGDAVWVYIAKGGLDEFAGLLNQENISFSTLTEEGWNYWDEEDWIFKIYEDREDWKELYKYLPSKFKVGGITKTEGFNLILVFANDSTLQTNTEPCTLDEIFEAIKVLQKPSMFGKGVKEFCL